MFLSRKVAWVSILVGCAWGGLWLLKASSALPDAMAQDEAAIRKYVENFGSAWNRHDAEGLFGKRAAEIDRINAFGGWIRDPEADVRVMQRLFSGPFRDRPHQAGAERIRFVTPEVALVVVHVVRPGSSISASGDRSLHVLIKRYGNWELTGFANVPIHPPSGAVREAEGQDVVY